MKEITRTVTLSGINDIMFDRYAGDNKTELTPEQKLYYAPDGKTLVMPSLNIVSFLCAQNTPSACKRFYDSREYKKMAQEILSNVDIRPPTIPFVRNGKEIQFGGFGGDGIDPTSKCYIRQDVARLEKGIPNPKTRPVLPTPWQLTFTLHMLENGSITEEALQNLFTRAGVAIGLGTFRGVFGKFVVSQWE